MSTPSPTTNRVSIIIPVYVPDLSLVGVVEKCITSLRESTTEPYELILVDDGSPIKLPILHTADLAILKGKNDGFTKTVNLGLANATGDILVIANDDLTFRPGWYAALMGALAEVSIAALRTTDEPLKSENFGSIWAMKRYAYERLGPLNEKFPHYFSDLDYNKRIKRSTLSYRKVKDFELEHVGKATYRAVDPQNKLYWDSATKYKEMYGVLD